MKLSKMVDLLYDKDTKNAYANLLELEMLCESQNVLYSYFDDFLAMIKSEKYVIRVRGFRLLCKQAKWDAENKINRAIDEIATVLYDEKPTAVRQALKALEDVVLHKKELNGKIREKVLSIDCFKYKDSMQGLISKDINHILRLTEE